MTQPSVIVTNALRIFPGAHLDGSQVSFNCSGPMHKGVDKKRSATCADKNGRPLVHCFGGCSDDDIAKSLNFDGEGDLYAALDGKRTPTVTQQELLEHPIERYTYHDEDGAPLYHIQRYAFRGEKTFRPFKHQRKRPGIGNLRRVVYRLHQLRSHVVWGEGERTAKVARRHGICATTCMGGAKGWRQDYATQLVKAGVTSMTILPDNDVPGREGIEAVARDCHAASIKVKIVTLPDLPEKGDLVDWITAGGTKADLLALTKLAPAYPYTCSLAHARTVFIKWLGREYDLAALEATLATAASGRLKGDPLWLLLISGSGTAKTETVVALSDTGAVLISTISSEGALLSGTPQRDNTAESTGGLLRELGPDAILVIKDVSSILSMSRDSRAGVLAAFREIHDGEWKRQLGTDGGKTLHWVGRITIIGAVTTAWDTYHAVIATLGDRFALLRVNSRKGRASAGRHAIANIGQEKIMRAELAQAVKGVLAGMSYEVAPLTETELTRLLDAANITTLCRTAVEVDHYGNPSEPHMPESPTRFAKQLTQMMRGAIAIGMTRTAALTLALRCARDSIPPLRLAALEDVATYPDSKLADVQKRLDLPRTTIERQLKSLHLCRVLTFTERTEDHKKTFAYQVATGLDPKVLKPRITVKRS